MANEEDFIVERAGVLYKMLLLSGVKGGVTAGPPEGETQASVGSCNPMGTGGMRGTPVPGAPGEIGERRDRRVARPWPSVGSPGPVGKPLGA